MEDDGPHTKPEHADTLLQIDLGEHGMPGEVEQVWARRIADHRFELCSVPFFAYGMTHGDEVQVDNDLRVKKVINRCGNVALRMFVEHDDAEPFRACVEQILDDLGLPHEWQGDGYVAIGLSDAGMPAEIVTMLDEWPKQSRPNWELV